MFLTYSTIDSTNKIWINRQILIIIDYHEGIASILTNIEFFFIFLQVFVIYFLIVIFRVLWKKPQQIDKIYGDNSKIISNKDINDFIS